MLYFLVKFVLQIFHEKKIPDWERREISMKFPRKLDTAVFSVAVRVYLVGRLPISRNNDYRW